MSAELGSTGLNEQQNISPVFCWFGKLFFSLTYELPNGQYEIMHTHEQYLDLCLFKFNPRFHFTGAC